MHLFNKLNLMRAEISEIAINSSTELLFAEICHFYNKISAALPYTVCNIYKPLQVYRSSCEIKYAIISAK